MVPEENAQSSVGCKKNQPRGATDGKCLKGTDEHDKEETARTPWPCPEKLQFRKRQSLGICRRYQSKRKAEDKVFGCSQDVGWSSKCW